jgi:hypothetical protein
MRDRNPVVDMNKRQACRRHNPCSELGRILGRAIRKPRTCGTLVLRTRVRGGLAAQLRRERSRGFVALRDRGAFPRVCDAGTRCGQCLAGPQERGSGIKAIRVPCGDGIQSAAGEWGLCHIVRAEVTLNRGYRAAARGQYSDSCKHTACAQLGSADITTQTRLDVLIRAEYCGAQPHSQIESVEGGAAGCEDGPEARVV